MTRFNRAYTGLYRLSARNENSPYRKQLLGFLSQARMLEGYAQADYGKALKQNSSDVLTPSLELAMVVDTVSKVSEVFGKPRDASSDSQLMKDIHAWLPRLDVGLQQDKDRLEFLTSTSKQAPADRGHLSDLNTLYSEAAVRVRQAHVELSAGDKLGAWLSVAQSSMLLGNLAMRLSQR